MKISLYVTRHGQVDWNEKGIINGQLNSPLTQKGIDASITTGKALEKVDFTKVYCSDQGRAKQTLYYLGLEDKAIFDPRLRDRNYGIYAGKPFKDYDAIKKDPLQAHKLKNEIESNESLSKKWVSLFNEIITDVSSEQHVNILVVTHATYVRTVAEEVLSFNPTLDVELRECSVKNNCLCEFDVTVEEGRVVSSEIMKLYDVSHLESCNGVVSAGYSPVDVS